MASLKSITEQVEGRLGDTSSGKRPHPLEIRAAIQQALNAMLAPQYFNTLNMGEGSIPEGCVMVTYDNVPVVSWNGVSKATLPAIPVSLPGNRGVWRIGPNPVSDYTQLEAPINLTLYPNPSDMDNSIMTQWENGGTITGVAYYWQIDTDPSFEAAATATEEAGTSLAIGTLTANTVYYFRIKATKTGYLDSEWTVGSTKTHA